VGVGGLTITSSRAKVYNSWSFASIHPTHIHDCAYSLRTYLLTYLLTYSLHGAGYYFKSCHSACKKISCFLYGTQRFITVLTKARQWTQPNPVRPIDPYLPKVHLNVILPSTPRSSHWSLTFGPPNQNPVNTSPLPMLRPKNNFALFVQLQNAF
jgi:hypothetical protein